MMRFLHTADLSLDGPTWPTQNSYILIETREDIVDHGVCCLGIIDSARTGAVFAQGGSISLCLAPR